MKKFIMFLLVLTAIIAVSAPSNALMLTIDDGAGGMSPIILTDTDNDGELSYMGSSSSTSVFYDPNLKLSSWILVRATGLSSPLIGNAGLPEMHLDSLEVSGLNGVLMVTLSDTFNSLNPKVTGFNSKFGGVTGGTISLTSSIDGVDIIDMGPFSGAFSANETVFTLPENTSDYTLSLMAIVKHTSKAQTTSFNADLTTVPEPGTLMLLGSGLAGVGFYTRRRRK